MNIFKISVSSINYEKNFLSTDNIFATMDVKILMNNNTFLKIIQENVGIELLEEMKKDGMININISVVNHRSIKTIQWILNEDVSRYVDVTYNMLLKEKNGSIKSLTKFGLKMQFLGLVTTLFSIAFLKNFPFSLEYFFIDFFILVLFISPLVMQYSFKSLKQRVNESFEDVYIEISENDVEAKKQLAAFQSFIKSKSIFSYYSLCEYVNNKK